MFQIFLGLSSLQLPSLSRFRSLGSMKLSVAPESTKILLSAIAREVRKDTGIFIERNRFRYTVLHRSV